MSPVRGERLAAVSAELPAPSAGGKAAPDGFGQRLGHLLRADDAAGGDAALDHERLAEHLRERRCEHARDEIARATRLAGTTTRTGFDG